MRDVVHHRVDEQHQSIRRRYVRDLSKCFAQPDDRQKTERRTKHDVERVERLFTQILTVETPIPGPHVHHSPHRTPHHGSWIALQDVEGLAPFCRHEPLFAQRLKFGQLGRVATWVPRPVPPVQLIPVVPVEEHHREGVFQENRSMKSPVVANHPRREDKEQDKPGGGCRNGPASFLSLESPANPSRKERQGAKNDRTGQRTQTPKESKSCPCPKASRALEVQRDQKQQGKK